MMGGSNSSKSSSAREPSSLDTGLHALRAQKTVTPAAVVGRVMTELHRQPRPGRLIPLPDGSSLSEVDIAAAIRNAADSLPEVTARGCRVRPSRDATGTPVIGPVTVELAVVMTYGSIIPNVSAALAAKLRATLVDRHGLTIDPLELTIEDLALETALENPAGRSPSRSDPVRPENPATPTVELP